MTPAPAERQQAGWRRGPITIPVLVGALVALLALGGGILVGSDRFGGRSASPTAETKQPTSQPAATAVPAVAASPAAAAKASPAATSAPSPTAARAVAAASPGAAAASPVAAGVAPAGDAAGRFLSDSMAALGRRDWSAALEQANAGLKVDPANPGLAKAAVQARLGLAEQLWSRGAGKEALPHFLAVREQPLRGAASTAELREADLSAPYIWGDLMASVDPPTAIFEYDKVFRRDPNFKDIRKKFYDLNVTLAKQFIGRGDREGAARYVNGARRANPDAPEVNDLTKSLTPTPS